MYTPLSKADLENYFHFSKKFAEALFDIRDYLISQQTSVTTSKIKSCWLDHFRSCDLEIFYPFANEKNSLGEAFGEPICISVNNCVAHGKNQCVIHPGDSVTIDAGISIKSQVKRERKLYFDSAVSCVVGSKEMPPEMQGTLEVLKQIGNYSTSKPLSLRPRDLSKIIYETLSSQSLSPIVSLSGHLIGYQMHMLPGIPNAVYSEHGYESIPPGALINPEPMAVANDSFTTCPTWLDNDYWSVLAPYRSSHWETTFYYNGNSLHDVMGITQEM